MHLKPFLMYAVWLIMALTICIAASAETSDDRFQFIILKHNWSNLRLRYDAQTALAILKTTATQDNLFSIDVQAIEIYDWDLQTITLTPEATGGLIKAVSELKPADPEIQKLTALKASLGWGNPLERALYAQAFVVNYAGQFLYGGIFLDPPSQMAIEYPVARLTLVDGKAVIALLPVHIPFVTVDPVDSAGQLRQPAITPEAQDDARQLDAFFTNMIRENATSADAQEFRQVIRDAQVKQGFEIAGKLKSSENATFVAQKKDVCRSRDCLYFEPPPELKCITHGGYAEYVGLFVNDGYAAWYGFDLDQQEYIGVQRYAGQRLSDAPQAVETSENHFIRTSGIGAQKIVDVVTKVMLDSEHLKPLICLANQVWSWTSAEPPEPRITDVHQAVVLVDGDSLKVIGGPGTLTGDAQNLYNLLRLQFNY